MSEFFNDLFYSYLSVILTLLLILSLINRFGNIDVRYVPRPQVISRYFNDSNCIDMHNQLRQHELGLEKKWITQDGNFRILTGLIAMTVIDTMKLGQFHGLLPRGK